MKYLEKVIKGAGIERRLIERTEKVAVYSVYPTGFRKPWAYEVIKPLVAKGIAFRDFPKTEDKELYPDIEYVYRRLWRFYNLEQAVEKYQKLTT